MKILLFILLFLIILVLIFIVLILYLRSLLQDSTVPVSKYLFASPTNRRVMCVFPHPDDEIVLAGTLLGYAEQGFETILVTLTHGEKGPTNGMVTQDELAKTRESEIRQSAAILGIKHLELFSYPDSGITSVPAEELKNLIYSQVIKHQPSVIFSYDEESGLYGHLDHRLVARYVHDVFEEHKTEPGFPVKVIHAVTMPKKTIELAMKIMPIVREGFQGDAYQRLPTADFAVRVHRYGKQKLAAIHAHATQHGVLSHFFPIHDKIPAWLYFFVFDREYFTIVSNITKTID